MARLTILCPKCRREFNGVKCNCGFSSPVISEPSLALPLYTLLSKRYLILRVLGQGGFGITYVAWDLEDNRICALKEYVPEGIAIRDPQWNMIPESSSDLTIYRHAMQRFLEEAAVLKRLSDVPEVVRVWDSFTENNTAYYVMEYIDGDTLRNYVKINGAMTPQQVTAVIKTLCRALIQLHTNTGILHRDISPENIMLTKQGHLKLIDFGSARILARQTSQNFTVILKAGCAPPEQYSSTAPQGPYTDLYALASTAFYLLTGKLPPDAPRRLNGAECPDLTTLCPNVPRRLSDAIAHALTLNYRQRTPDAATFLKELDADDIKSASGNTFNTDTCNSNIASAENSLAYVEFITPKHEKYRLTDNVTAAAGRSPNSAIWLSSDTRISGTHFLVCYDSTGDRFLLKDVSTNGISVDGHPLKKNTLYSIPIDTTLDLSSGICTLRLSREKST